MLGHRELLIWLTTNLGESFTVTLLSSALLKLAYVWNLDS
jgi:hypothetical protein